LINYVPVDKDTLLPKRSTRWGEPMLIHVM